MSRGPSPHPKTEAEEEDEGPQMTAFVHVLCLFELDAKMGHITAMDSHGHCVYLGTSLGFVQ
eukprot:gene18626-6060_t